MEKEKPMGVGALPRAALVLAFIASWLALIALMLRTIEKIWPAMTVADPASLAAGALLIPMTIFLIQGIIHVPRGQHRPIFLRARVLTRFSILLLPALKRMEPGPALDLITSSADRDTIVAEAEARLKSSLGIIPRLALLLDNRSPLEIILNYLMTSRILPLTVLGWIFFLIVGPARQFMRVWGYVFTRLWRDPGPEDELTTYKRKVAYDLAGRATRFGINDLNFEEARTLLARIWRELKRVHNNPFYGQDVGQPLPDMPEPEDSGLDPVAAFYHAPWLAPRYCGVYLDLSVTLAARTVDELYDSWRDEDTSVFYPTELSQEVESASWLLADRTRLQKILSERMEEGIVRLDGRPIPTWTIESWLFDLEGDLNYYKQRIAAHHRRCRTAHLMKARRLGLGWPEYLRGMAGVLHFAEHARRALTTAKADFEEVLRVPEKAHGQTLREAARLHNLMADLHDRIIHLDLTDELEVRPDDLLPLALPSPTDDLHTWRECWAREHYNMTTMLSALKDKSLTALLWGEDQVAGRGRASSGNGSSVPEAELEEAPPAPGIIPDFVSIRPPVNVPERVYSTADRLKVGFGHTLLAALVLALLLWQSQTLGRTRLVVYNGLGRDVTVWVGDDATEVKPYGRSIMHLQPAKIYTIATTTGGLPLKHFNQKPFSKPVMEVPWARGHLIEHFTRKLSPKPATEVYNIAGAAPLMEWWSPRNTDNEEEGLFLGRPRWLTTNADVLFQTPPSNGDRTVLVLSGYGELPPAEMLPAFFDQKDKAELIHLHALWDNPDSPGFLQWQFMILGKPQAAILVQRLAREPDFLEKCVRELDTIGFQ
ncbi:hypothetical protein C4J81_02750 [Deltaproteobacteria bacterium Smac51]|nr:hypothetical protein C4J81_02750 [Deltaproteobacteria bacterium Smac51]